VTQRRVCLPTMSGTLSLDSVRRPVPYLIVATSIPRTVRRLVRTVWPWDELEFVAIWNFTSLAEYRGCFIIDAHFFELLVE
jgi:hypothetical protein